MSSLLGFIETLRGPAQGDADASDRFLGIMEDEAKRMARLINDLLTLSKVETDEHIRPEESVELEPILAQVANTLLVRAQERGMQINIQSADKMPAVVGASDELTQVFQNLLSNAVTYGHRETPIQVTMTLQTEVPGTNVPAMAVSVINQGDGISIEDIPRLTERFYRADKGRSRSMGGTGLGLAIVKHIVARHRGHLEIISEAGKETTFTVFLPVSPNLALS